MCESEGGFRAFWAGFGFGFRAKNLKFGFNKKRVDWDSNPDSIFLVPITFLLFLFLTSSNYTEMPLLPLGAFYDQLDSNPDSDSKQLDSDSRK